MRFRASIPLADIIGYVFFLGIFLSIGSFGFKAVHEHLVNDSAVAGASTIAAAICQYHYEIGEYPDSLADLVEKKGQYGPWLKEVPIDPWSQGNYIYLHDDDGFAVYSVGPDRGSNSSLQGIGDGDLGCIGR